MKEGGREGRCSSISLVLTDVHFVLTAAHGVKSLLIIFLFPELTGVSVSGGASPRLIDARRLPSPAYRTTADALSLPLSWFCFVFFPLSLRPLSLCSFVFFSCSRSSGHIFYSVLFFLSSSVFFTLKNVILPSCLLILLFNIISSFYPTLCLLSSFPCFLSILPLLFCNLLVSTFICFLLQIPKCPLTVPPLCSSVHRSIHLPFLSPPLSLFLSTTGTTRFTLG